MSGHMRLTQEEQFETYILNQFKGTVSIHESKLAYTLYYSSRDSEEPRLFP